MNGEAYYDYQATARGLISAAEVDAATDFMAFGYRHLLPEWMPHNRSAAIYEVACGPGILLRYLKREGYTNISGSDSSPAQIQLARAAGLPVVLGDSLNELAHHPDNNWDCLFAIDFIEHLTKDDLIQFLALSCRKLKPGGVLILRAPNGDSPFVGRNLFNDITHVWAYTTIAMRALLQMAGFKDANFRDESIASLQRMRWLKAPVMALAQRLTSFLIRLATREDIRYLGPSIYVFARK